MRTQDETLQVLREARRPAAKSASEEPPQKRLRLAQLYFSGFEPGPSQPFRGRPFPGRPAGRAYYHGPRAKSFVLPPFICPSRTPQILPESVETPLKGSMGTRSGSRRSCRAVGKRGHFTHSHRSGKIFVPFLRDTKDRGQVSPNSKSQETKRVYPSRAFQDRRGALGQTHNQTRRLSSSNRPTGCLSLSGHSCLGPPLATFPVAKSPLSVECAPFRPALGAASVHQAHEAGDGTFSLSQTATSDLFGRPPHHEPITHAAQESRRALW